MRPWDQRLPNKSFESNGKTISTEKYPKTHTTNGLFTFSINRSHITWPEFVHDLTKMIDRTEYQPLREANKFTDGSRRLAKD